MEIEVRLPTWAIYRVYAFLLIGMINWIGLWFKPSGRMSRDELYGRISHLFLEGFMSGYPAEDSFAARAIADFRRSGQMTTPLA